VVVSLSVPAPVSEVEVSVPVPDASLVPEPAWLPSPALLPQEAKEKEAAARAINNTFFMGLVGKMDEFGSGPPPGFSGVTWGFMPAYNER
jgi:hypothetical protein